MPLTWKTDLSIHECIHESTVHINRIPHEEPLVVQENSIQDDTRPEEMSTNEQTITNTYTDTEGTTQRGQRKLVSSDGFTYVFTEVYALNWKNTLMIYINEILMFCLLMLFTVFYFTRQQWFHLCV